MMKTLKGFTLAEVLTTLMVIGVVAAMTIPTLLNSTSDQQLKVAYKKAMSVLGQGVQLMVAKETECTVQTNADLAKCFATNVLSGTRLDGAQSGGVVNSTDTNNNTVVTSDGLAYQFFYKTSGAQNYDRTLEDICGTMAEAGATQGAYDGSSANDKCMVIVDVNGLSKGAKYFKLAGDNTSTFNNAAISSGAIQQGTEQFPMLITGTGVRPMYVTGDAALNKGYGYMFGKDASPFSGS